jgi:hypothetical protein
MSRTGGEAADRGIARASPESRGAIETLQWCGEFLSRRSELFVPVVALGALQALLSAGLAFGIDPEPLSVIRLVVYIPATVLVAGMITLAVADDIQGRWRSNEAYASAATEHLVTGIVVWILILIAVAIGVVFLIVPGLYIGVRFAFAIPAVFLDDRGIGESLRDSWERTKGHGWTIFGIAALLFVASVVIQAASGLDSLLVSAVASGLATIVVLPLAVGSFAYLYLATRTPDAGTPTTEARAGTRQQQRPTSGQSTPSQSSPAERATGQERSARRQQQPQGDTRQQRQGGQAGQSPGGQGRPDRGPTPSGTDHSGGDPPRTASDRSGQQPGSRRQPDSTGQPADQGRPAESGQNRPPSQGESGSADAGSSGGPTENGSAELPAEETARIAQLTDEVDAGEAGPERIDPLIELLDSEFPAVRREAATALGTLGARYPDRAVEALEALRDVRLDPDTEVSEAASNAVQRIKENA